MVFLVIVLTQLFGWICKPNNFSRFACVYSCLFSCIHSWSAIYRRETNRRFTRSVNGCDNWYWNNKPFLTIILLLSNNYIIEFLNVPISMSNGTSTYLSVISVGLLFQGGNTVFTSIYRIYANGNYAMYVGILTNTLNILGDACVVFNPLKYDYDCIFGVAAATVVSNFIGFILMLYYYNCNISIEHIFIHSISADNVKILMKYGIPAAGENISYKISQLFVTVFITSLGSYILTSKIYAMNIMLFVSLIPNSIGIATGIIVGYLFGEKSMMFCLKNAIKISK